MNRAETIATIAYLNRAGALHVLEGQVDVWLDALEDVPAAYAQEAARDIVRRRTSQDRPVVPGDLRAAAQASARRRVETARVWLLANTPADVDDTWAWQRRAESFIAEGMDVQAAAAEATRRAVGA